MTISSAPIVAHSLQADEICEVRTGLNESLCRSVRWLCSQGISHGHWGDVRSTSLAVTALRHLGVVCTGGPWLEVPAQWIIDHKRTEGDGFVSWESEIWDTSLALLALDQAGISKSHPVVQDGIQWIGQKLEENRCRNWHFEPWETSLALLALFETKGADLLTQQCSLSAPIEWLISMQGSSGFLISSHYTAFLVRILHTYLSTEQCEECKVARFSTAAQQAIGSLKRELTERPIEELWSVESWANGQILWCLDAVGALKDVELIYRASKWFGQTQTVEGGFEDVEDTAWACLGLFALATALEEICPPEEHDHTEARSKCTSRLRHGLELPVITSLRPFIEWQGGALVLTFSPRSVSVMKFVGLVVGAAATISGAWQLFEIFFA